jgi:mono/diheme cytochrome c family protein
MPPYSHVLSDAEVAAVVSYVRASWGNHARMVTAPEVNDYRAVPLD